MDGKPTAESIAAFAAARERVLATVAQACARSGRDPAGVQLVAVSKTVPVERLVAAAWAGLTVLGENRVQEAEPKVAALSGVRWHLVGHLQANKARRAVGLFETIESVDSVELAIRLDRLVAEVGRAPLDVYLQVNVDRDEAKEGFLPEQLETALPELGRLSNLRFRGLMTVGRLVQSAEQARPTFVRLRELSESLRSAGGGTLEAGLSMGMTDDYPVAVEEGATVIRVGRAIFGPRPIG